MKAPNEARALRPLPSLIFASRWLQLPLYLGLIIAQGVYVWLFWQELYYLLLAAFGNGNALGHVIDAVTVEGVNRPAKLTETVIMANAQQTADKLQAFRNLGVTLAIDDFGTGYSSLAYLKRLPINTLKIDKEFVDDLSHGSEDAAITTTVLAMARSLGLNVVAEGVETEAQLQFLRLHDCDEIQGFWLSPALEPEQCQAFIQGWTTPAPAFSAAMTGLEPATLDPG